MRVTTYPLGPLGTNSYLVDDGQSALAIDVGGDPAPMLDFMAQNGLKLLAILITHRHFDHLYGVHALQEATGAPCYISAKDQPLAADESSRGGIWGMPVVPAFREEALPADEFVAGPFHAKILETPGHTPGGVSYYFADENVVFTGDTLFYRSIGRTDFALGDHQALLSSCRTKLFVLPGGTVVYPGHGPQTSIGDEKKHNPFVGDFS